MRQRVAIVGMSIRTAGARNITEFWDMLQTGGNGCRWLDDNELARRGVPYRRYSHSDYVSATYPLDEPLAFDCEAFGFSPAEAEWTDPQHRIIIEECYRAVESSGHYIGSLPGVVGVYLGAKASNHGALLERTVWPDIDGLEAIRLGVGNNVDYLASRLAYKYGLTGPALTVQTACSTSAVAIHLASQAILAGECDSAIVGGGAIDLQDAGYLYYEGGIYSRRGRCEPFMATADGTVEGNGVAALFLRKLDVALDQGDPVLAVIEGTAVNNDGRDRAGFSAPSVSGQVAVIEEALEVAELKADRIDLLEAHGTGTSLGDALEIEAASKAFFAYGATPEATRLSSIKANVGHLAAAAGAAGVIAAVLAMRHEAIPPNLPLVQGADPVDLSETPFRLSAEVSPWRRGDRARYAAISSFGLGGTNAHIVIGDPEDEEVPRRGDMRPVQLMPLSADDPDRLAGTVRAARRAIEGASATERHDVCHTARTGRPALAVRAAVLIPATGDSTRITWPSADDFREPGAESPDVVYLLPGQGGRAADAACRLYAREPEFRRTVERGLAVMRQLVTAETHTRIMSVFEDGVHISDTQVAQPVLHLLGLGVHAMLERLGIRPAALLGHSVGEITAACLSGIMSFEDAAHAVCLRATAMADMPPGAMFAVRTSVESLNNLPEGCAVSVVNGPRATVVSAAADAVPGLLDWFERHGVQYRRLETSHAFHHESMAPAAARFARQLDRVHLRPPRTPLVSCRSGDWLTEYAATDPAYWGDQLRERVEFAQAVATVVARYPTAVYVQIGPGTELVRAAAHLGGVDPGRCLAALPGGDTDAQRTLLLTVGRLWEHGRPVDWAAYEKADHGLGVAQLPRSFRSTPVLHPNLADKLPAIDPADLPERAAARSAAPAPRTERDGHRGAERDTERNGDRGAERDTDRDIGCDAERDSELQPLVDAVTRCWTEVLGTEPGPHADFFSSGGDSITAAQIVTRLRTLFPVEIPVHLPLTARSPHAIASALDEIFIAEIAES